MKRDMDLCREILRQMEAHPDPNAPFEINVEGRSPEEINYHVYLLSQASLIDAIDASSTTELEYLPVRLTWTGHEFLETSRDDTIWRRGKEMVLKAGGGLSYDALSAVLTALIRQGTTLDL